MEFTKNGEPLFEQIIKRIRQYVTAGVYQPDERLPSVRELASAMNVNPKTVVRAYEVLEQEGLLYSLHKKGYYVAPVKDAQKQNMLAEFCKMLPYFLETLTKEELIRAIEEGDDRHD